MKHPDLFGGMTEIKGGPARGWAEVKRSRNYREAETKSESCKQCTHRLTKKFSKNYHKCKLLSLKAAPTSDIRLKMVCDLFEAAEV